MALFLLVNLSGCIWPGQRPTAAWPLLAVTSVPLKLGVLGLDTFEFALREMYPSAESLVCLVLCSLRLVPS